MFVCVCMCVCACLCGCVCSSSPRWSRGRAIFARKCARKRERESAKGKEGESTSESRERQKARCARSAVCKVHESWSFMNARRSWGGYGQLDRSNWRSFLQNRLFYRALSQKRPTILRSLLIVAPICLSPSTLYKSREKSGMSRLYVQSLAWFLELWRVYAKMSRFYVKMSRS